MQHQGTVGTVSRVKKLQCKHCFGLWHIKLRTKTALPQFNERRPQHASNTKSRNSYLHLNNIQKCRIFEFKKIYKTGFRQVNAARSGKAFQVNDFNLNQNEYSEIRYIQNISQFFQFSKLKEALKNRIHCKNEYKFRGEIFTH